MYVYVAATFCIIGISCLSFSIPVRARKKILANLLGSHAGSFYTPRLNSVRLFSEMISSLPLSAAVSVGTTMNHRATPNSVYEWSSSSPAQAIKKSYQQDVIVRTSGSGLQSSSKKPHNASDELTSTCFRCSTSPTLMDAP